MGDCPYVTKANADKKTNHRATRKEIEGFLSNRISVPLRKDEIVCPAWFRHTKSRQSREINQQMDDRLKARPE